MHPEAEVIRGRERAEGGATKLAEIGLDLAHKGTLLDVNRCSMIASLSAENSYVWVTLTLGMCCFSWVNRFSCEFMTPRRCLRGQR